ncbi:MAG: hypothetical protein ACXWJK_05160, partial [Burkholderiaceae bacterium]
MSIFKKICFLIGHEQRFAALLLLGMMFIGMLLETLSVGLVIPALALMTQSNLSIKYPAVATVLNKCGNPTHQQLIIVGMIALV